MIFIMRKVPVPIQINSGKFFLVIIEKLLEFLKSDFSVFVRINNFETDVIFSFAGQTKNTCGENGDDDETN